MKLSTTTAFYRDRPGGRAQIPIMDSVRKLHKIGFEDIDFNFCLMNQYDLELSGDGWQKWIGEMGELMEELGMTAGQAHTPFYNVLDKNFPNREHTEEMVRRSIIAAGELGVKAIVIHTGTYFDNIDYKKMRRDNIEYLKPHLELAEKYNLYIAVENLLDTMDKDRGYRKRHFGSCPEDLVELVDELKKEYSNIGICWDFGHANEMGWDQVQSLEYIGKRLVAVHVQDNYGVNDDHLLPYHGTIEWEPIMKTLKKIDYQGVFAYETHRASMRVPEPVIDALLTYAFQLGNYLISLSE